MQSWVGESQKYKTNNRAITNKTFLKFLRYILITGILKGIFPLK